jgi:hypothetical protein
MDGRKEAVVGIGVSIFLVAVGAILAFAVETHTRGVDLNTVGVILMIVGGLGFFASLAFWSSFAPWGGSRRDETVIVEEPHLTHHHY